MARIRTIKPEFWTDEKLVECSRDARLLFIGLLNFADDNGNMVFSSVRIKMQVFPGDSIDILPLINELITHGVICEYSVSDDKYLHIKGFKKHQYVQRPSKSNIPEPILTEYSVTEGKGIGKEEESKKENKYRFAATVIRLTEKDYLNLKKTYFAIPDFDAELKAADQQYEREPPGNWFIALGNRLNGRHQFFLSKAPPGKQKIKRENVIVIGAPL